jgi:hypothetical protein
MINAGNEHDGTYKRFDVDQKVATILNNFQVPAAGRAKRLYVYKETCDVLTRVVSYTAFIKWEKMDYHASRKGSNTFWETGYVGEHDGFPYYSTKANARRAVALRVLVDFFAYKQRHNRTTPRNSYWPEAIMNKTSITNENFVILVENKGAGHNDDHLFCILLKHGPRYTLMVPRDADHKPWKEVEFQAKNWSKKRGANG